MPKFLEIVGYLLFPFSLLHLLVIKIRHYLYDHHILKSCNCGLPVISVGNIQVGGTGKTPLVELIAKILLQLKYRPVIISRGYGRLRKEPLLVDVLNRDLVTPEQIGDEPFQYLQNIPDIILGIDGNRCRMAQQIKDQYPDAVILLDDALQHRKIERMLDIVTVDGTRWSSGPMLFPFTAFRDSKSILKKADVFVCTGSGQSGMADKLSALQKPLFFSEIIPEELSSLDNKNSLSPAVLRGLRVGVICGLAHPQKLLSTLQALGAQVVFEKNFRDHHHYQRNEIKAVLEKAKSAGAELIITTQKDAVKLQQFAGEDFSDLYVLRIHLKIKAADDFKNLIETALKS